MRLSMSRSIVALNVAESAFSCGKRVSADHSARRSLPFTEPYTTRVIMRSRSKMPVSASVTSSKSGRFSNSSSTAFCRSVMPAGLKSGCSSHVRISRLPIAVLVLSSTHKSEPRRSLLRIVSSNSRFRRVFKSSRIVFACEYMRISSMRSKPVICVRLRYSSKALSAAVISGKFKTSERSKTSG